MLASSCVIFLNVRYQNSGIVLAQNNSNDIQKYTFVVIRFFFLIDLLINLTQHNTLQFIFLSNNPLNLQFHVPSSLTLGFAMTDWLIDCLGSQPSAQKKLPLPTDCCAYANDRCDSAYLYYTYSMSTIGCIQKMYGHKASPDHPVMWRHSELASQISHHQCFGTHQRLGRKPDNLPIRNYCRVLQNPGNQFFFAGELPPNLLKWNHAGLDWHRTKQFSAVPIWSLNPQPGGKLGAESLLPYISVYRNVFSKRK